MLRPTGVLNPPIVKCWHYWLLFSSILYLCIHTIIFVDKHSTSCDHDKKILFFWFGDFRAKNHFYDFSNKKELLLAVTINLHHQNILELHILPRIYRAAGKKKHEKIWKKIQKSFQRSEEFESPQDFSNYL